MTYFTTFNFIKIWRLYLWDKLIFSFLRLFFKNRKSGVILKKKKKLLQQKNFWNKIKEELLQVLKIIECPKSHFPRAILHEYLTLNIGPGGTDVIANYDNQDLWLNFPTFHFQFQNANGNNLGTYGKIVSLSGDFFLDLLLHLPTYVLEQITQKWIIYFKLHGDDCGMEKGYLWLWQLSFKVGYFVSRRIISCSRSVTRQNKIGMGSILANLSESSDGGVQSSLFWQNGLFDTLLNNFFDHYFGNCAVLTYQTAHRNAMAIARSAGIALNSANFSSLPSDQRAQILNSSRSGLINAF